MTSTMRIGLEAAIALAIASQNARDRGSTDGELLRDLLVRRACLVCSDDAISQINRERVRHRSP